MGQKSSKLKAKKHPPQQTPLNPLYESPRETGVVQGGEMVPTSDIVPDVAPKPVTVPAPRPVIVPAPKQRIVLVPDKENYVKLSSVTAPIRKVVNGAPRPVSVPKQRNGVAPKQGHLPKQGKVAVPKKGKVPKQENASAIVKKKSSDNPVQSRKLIILPKYVTDLCKEMDNIFSNEGDRVRELIKSKHLTPGHSQTYEDLFAPYMTTDLIVITIGEPHIFQTFQYLNLVKFIECCVVHAPNLKLINLKTRVSDNPEEQKRNFQDISDSLSERGIKFDVKFSSFHDRKIIFNTNYLFRLGKGLHFYEKASGQSRKYFVGMSDQRLRRCQDTNVDAFMFVY